MEPLQSSSRLVRGRGAVYSVASRLSYSVDIRAAQTLVRLAGGI